MRTGPRVTGQCEVTLGGTQPLDYAFMATEQESHRVKIQTGQSHF